ncbi:hypothetical protein GG344DRAFT_66669 [Lentinula edodes]|nr:hypothetical protein GG344DRAFT_66669 [Lentinula edodes]
MVLMGTAACLQTRSLITLLEYWITQSRYHDWDIQTLIEAHNSDNEGRERWNTFVVNVNEPECVIDWRVLGALHLSRLAFSLLDSLTTRLALGDTPFKQPPELTRDPL